MNRDTVHFLASPFPTNQGTQASVAAFVRAADTPSARHVLLVPAESHGDDPVDLTIERLPRLPLRFGTRSGPSFARLASDLATLATIRRQVRGRALVAHNVEAAFVAAMARIPFVYVAHTAMSAELPLYGARAGDAMRRVGGLLDRISVTRARRTLAITPALARSLADRFGRTVTYLPQPWKPAPPTGTKERDDARRDLAVGGALVVLHAGNLDRYQGIDTIAGAVRELARIRRVVFLVATGSGDPFGLEGVETKVHPLADEVDRRRVHAAADLVLLARAPTLGLPIKMLEAFARGVPVVATRTSLSGLALHDELVVTEDSADALARGVPWALEEAPVLVESARRHLLRHHSADEARAVLGAATESGPRCPRR